MKKIKYVLIMFVAVMVSVSCSKDDDDNFDDNFGDNVGDNALVGTWGLIELEDGSTLTETATFNENLSGTLVSSSTFEGETESTYDSFTWSTNGNKLRLIFDGETEILTYSISGDKLTVTTDVGDTIVFTKQQGI
jgi:hypothetical protein